jgi:hypothetical protein
VILGKAIVSLAMRETSVEGRIEWRQDVAAACFFLDISSWGEIDVMIFQLLVVME